MSTSASIRQAVTQWPGITEAPHRFGGIEFQLEGREIGHLHGDRLLDIPFPRKVRDEIVAAGQASPHHILPESGWISFWLKGETDAEAAVALLRRSYDLVGAQQQRRAAQNARARAPQ
jgi:hypothetical protein